MHTHARTCTTRIWQELLKLTSHLLFLQELETLKKMMDAIHEGHLKEVSAKHSRWAGSGLSLGHLDRAFIPPTHPPILLFWLQNKQTFRFWSLAALFTHILCVQRIMGFFLILVTHKSTGSENPVTLVLNDISLSVGSLVWFMFIRVAMSVINLCAQFDCFAFASRENLEIKKKQSKQSIEANKNLAADKTIKSKEERERYDTRCSFPSLPPSPLRSPSLLPFH